MRTILVLLNRQNQVVGNLDLQFEQRRARHNICSLARLLHPASTLQRLCAANRDDYEQAPRTRHPKPKTKLRARTSGSFSRSQTTMVDEVRHTAKHVLQVLLELCGSSVHVARRRETLTNSTSFSVEHLWDVTGPFCSVSAAVQRLERLAAFVGAQSESFPGGVWRSDRRTRSSEW